MSIAYYCYIDHKCLAKTHRLPWKFEFSQNSEVNKWVKFYTDPKLCTSRHQPLCALPYRNMSLGKKEQELLMERPIPCRPSGKQKLQQQRTFTVTGQQWWHQICTFSHFWLFAFSSFQLFPQCLSVNSLIFPAIHPSFSLPSAILSASSYPPSRVLLIAFPHPFSLTLAHKVKKASKLSWYSRNIFLSTPHNLSGFVAFRLYVLPGKNCLLVCLYTTQHSALPPYPNWGLRAFFQYMISKEYHLLRTYSGFPHKKTIHSP